MHTNETIEQAIIGTLFLNPKAAVPELINTITPEYFTDPVLKIVYAEAIEMYAEHGYADYIPLLKKLDEVFKIKDIKPKDYAVLIKNCVDIQGNTAALPSYIKILTDCYKARKLTEIFGKYILENAPNPDIIDNQLEEIGGEISNLLRNDNKKGLADISDVALELYKNLFDKNLLKDKMKTGFPKFDAIIKGVSKKNLVVLAARPAVGKSAMALNLALNISGTGKKVALFSLEMGKEEIFERCMANLAPINLGILQDKDFGETTARNLADALSKLGELPIYINDNGYQTVKSIRTDVQVKKIDMVIIDYLQLITPSGRSENRTNEISKITRELKCMAQDLDIPVIVLSQLNRAKDENQEPALSDLRDSGAIEQDANMVWFMWLNKARQEGEIKQIAFKCAKNRNGMIGGVVMKYYGGTMHFVETNEKIIQKTQSKTDPWESQ